MKKLIVASFFYIFKTLKLNFKPKKYFNNQNNLIDIVST